MITFCTGDLFLDPAFMWVNTINCQGVMGKGIALEFKRRFPAMFEAYKVACGWGHVQIGHLHVYDQIYTDGRPSRRIINFPTKQHWRDPSQYPWIEAGLKALRAHLLPGEYGCPDVAIPALGCTCGGLRWDIVSGMINNELRGLPHNIRVYEPNWRTP